MKKLILLLAAAVALPAAAWDYPATSHNCSVKFINQVAEKDGMEKARHLSSKCISKGFNESKEWSKEHSSKAWEKTKKGSEKAWNNTKKGTSKAWEGTKKGTSKAWDKTKKVSEKSWNKTVKKTKDFFN